MSDEEDPSSYGLEMGCGVNALARTQVYWSKTKLKSTGKYLAIYILIVHW